jgi:hypothetical protein
MKSIAIRNRIFRDGRSLNGVAKEVHAMPHELDVLVAERESARSALIQARIARDSASRYLDAVLDDLAAMRAAWDVFTATQEAMDRACSHLTIASSAVIAYLMEDRKRRGKGQGAPTNSSEN